MTVPSHIEVATLLRRAQLRKQAACEAALNGLGMTMAQWGMAHAAAVMPDSSTHALALFTGQSDQAAGAVVAKLQQQGFLDRRSEGGKSILHRLTAAGREKLEQCDKVISGVMDHLLAGLTGDDLGILEKCLITISEAAPGAMGRVAPGDRSGLSGTRPPTEENPDIHDGGEIRRA
jgi:DNA-binding MarR family transcriptional regulator